MAATFYYTTGLGHKATCKSIVTWRIGPCACNDVLFTRAACPYHIKSWFCVVIRLSEYAADRGSAVAAINV
jgi:hypothetical protein